jgi:hypothetical protein
MAINGKSGQIIIDEYYSMKEKLKDFIEANPKLVRMQESVRYPGLYVIKYKKRVFYDNLWNDILEECRGLVVDADFNIVSRPFTKIYNYGVEKRAPKFEADTLVDAYRKVNGFMAALTWYNGDILVSTTGSLDSKFVDYVYDLIDVEKYRQVLAEWPSYTFMFECVHPDDPHIIPEQAGMYLLGYRRKAWNSVAVGTSSVQHWFGSLPVEYFYVTVEELQRMAKECKHEGFVFYDEDGRAAKIKSPYYLTCKWVARNPRTDKLMRPDIKKSLDEEYYPLIDAIQYNIEDYTAMNEQERLQWVRNFLENSS